MKHIELRSIEDWSSGILNGDDSADIVVCADVNPRFLHIDENEALVNPKAVDVESLLDGGKLRHVISDETVDRHGDVIRVSGWDLTQYKKNPVILLAHSHVNLPIGRSLSVTKKLKSKQLVSIGEYPSAALYQDANDVFRLAASGFINGSSVGFMPKEWVPIDEEAPWLGYEILKQELWEYSIVPVPANPNALINAAKTLPGGVKFVKRWAETTLDMCKNEAVETAVHEALNNAIGNPVSVVIEYASSVDDDEYSKDASVDEEELLQKIEECEDEYDTLSNVEGGMFIDTRDHDEDTFIKKETKTDPVIISIISEPTFDVDESVIKNMVADAVTKMTGRLIDREESNGND